MHRRKRATRQVLMLNSAVLISATAYHILIPRGSPSDLLVGVSTLAMVIVSLAYLGLSWLGN